MAAGHDSSHSGRLASDNGRGDDDLVASALSQYRNSLLLGAADASAASFNHIDYGLNSWLKRQRGRALAAGAFLVFAFLNREALQAALDQLLTTDWSFLSDIGESIRGLIDQSVQSGVSDQLPSGNVDPGSLRSVLDPILEQHHLNEAALRQSEENFAQDKEAQLKKLAEGIVEEISQRYLQAEKPARLMTAALEASLQRKFRLLHRIRIRTAMIAHTIGSLNDIKTKRHLGSWQNRLQQAIRAFAEETAALVSELQSGDQEIIDVYNKYFSGKRDLEKLLADVIVAAFKEEFATAFNLSKVALECANHIGEGLRLASQQPNKAAHALVKIYAVSLAATEVISDHLPPVRTRGKSGGQSKAFDKVTNSQLKILGGVLALIALYIAVFEPPWGGGGDVRDTDQAERAEPNADIPVIDAAPAEEETQTRPEDSAPADPYERISLQDIDGVISFDAPGDGSFFAFATNEGVSLYELDGSLRQRFSPFYGQFRGDPSDSTAQIVARVQSKMGFDIAISPSGRLIAATGVMDRKLIVRDMATRRNIIDQPAPRLPVDERTLHNNENGLLGQLVFSPDGDKLLGTSGVLWFRGTTVHLWDVNKRHKHEVELPGRQWYGSATVFSVSGDKAYVGAYSRTGSDERAPVLYAYATSNGLREIAAIPLNMLSGQRPISMIMLSDNRLALLTFEGSLTILDPTTGESLNTGHIFDADGLSLLYDEKREQIIAQGCDADRCFLRTYSIDGAPLKEWPVWPNQQDKRAMGWMFLDETGKLVAFDPAEFNMMRFAPS